MLFTCFFKISFGGSIDQKASKELEDFLSSINTAEGSGVQEFEGKKSEFKFFLKVPGKFKIDYQAEDTPVTIILNNNVLTYYDKILDQKTQLPKGQTIPFLPLSHKLSMFSPEIEVISLKSISHEIILEFKSKSKQEQNKFILFFDKKDDINLSKIEIISKEGKVLFMIRNIVINEKLSDDRFFIPNKKIL